MALARALLRDPLVYLLDEPMSNLDAQLREELRPDLRRLIMGGPQPVVYVTHDQQEAMALADRIAVLRAGRIEQIGTPEQLYNAPKTQFVAQFIGRPPMNLLNPRVGWSWEFDPNTFAAQDELNYRLLNREWLGKVSICSWTPAEGRCGWSAQVNMPWRRRAASAWEQEREHSSMSHIPTAHPELKIRECSARPGHQKVT